MKVEAGTVTIVRISDLMASHRLDPVRVTLDDIESGRGRITIECYGKAWASYWGAMSGLSIAQFFASCDNGYLIDNLAPNLRGTKFSGDGLDRHARKTICEMRRKRTLDHDAAREVFDRVQDIAGCQSLDACAHADHDLMVFLYGDEWWYGAEDAASVPNPEYDYLSRICDAVREALKQLPA